MVSGDPQDILETAEELEFEFIKKVEPFLEGLYRYYFRCDVQGWENVPNQTALYVSNHNGLLTFEVIMLFYAWWKHTGGNRKALGLAHSVALENPFFKWLIPRLGAIPAEPELAYQALKKDFSLLVYPGGLKENFRPYRERKEIDFYQRKGFLRLALRAEVPLVPVVSIGAHESYIILSRGEEIAKKLGLKDKYRIPGFPITYRSLFFFWCVATGLFTFFPLLLAPGAFAATFVPLPTKMTFRILPAMDLKSKYKSTRSEEENLQVLYDWVLSEMRKVHREEYEKRKYPILG